MIQTNSLRRFFYFLFIIMLVCAALYFAKPFLVPVCFGGLLAMLFLPVSRWLEKHRWPRGLAILTCLLAFLGILAVIIWVISLQVSDLAKEVGNVQQKVNQLITEVKNYINSTFGISPKRQEELLQQQQQSAGGNGLISQITSSLFGFVVDFVLVLVYVFLFMFYRTHIKKFILKLVPQPQQSNAQQTLRDIQRVSQQYLTGLGLMIVGLWILYSIGFSIVGVKQSVFFAILCGLLEIVPFVGNLTGNLITILMVVIQGGGMGMVLGVVITYALVQFFQSYILEPLVVGAEVNINPLFTILVLVGGELLWGIAGMVLSIPLLGIVKIICDHVAPLRPFGFLIGRKGKGRG